MGTDFSRVRLDALLDYAGVELKQGAVLLDGDANEMMDILDRRLRALASDVLGRATVSSTTPDAFKIELTSGVVTIGVGRLYVDGLLAECHGGDPVAVADQRFDSLLAEPRFRNPIPYAKQPYGFEPSPLPPVGRHLFYLDVWNREVTHLEQPDLVEIAVGVEATSRVQTVWRVRWLSDVGSDTTCASPDADLPGWAAVIAPSTGMLTTDTYEVDPPKDPCELPPTGGYRGLENQLYRVEIHNSSASPGGATFKWSRDNASVGSRVASIVSATELDLETLGRDDVLSFKTGDWVEITDDFREFKQRRGDICQISVDAARRRITLTPALSSTLLPLPTTLPNSSFPNERNMRVRRWDQSGIVNRTDPSGTPVQVQNLNGTPPLGGTPPVAILPGVIKVPDSMTTLILEHGITVQFHPGPNGFRSGDYWVFAARTADASVEKLRQAPPRGIHHHYARLAIWEVGQGFTDCRHKWPPEGGHDCSCTACVTEESHVSKKFTIQAAVEKVKETGGTVCLGPGQYRLDDTVQIEDAVSVRIRGQGLASLILAPEGVSAFAISGSLFTTIEDLGIFSAGARPAIAVDTAIGLSLTRLIVGAVGQEQGRGIAISLQGLVADATIAENVIFAPTGIYAHAIGEIDPHTTAGIGDFTILFTAALKIDDNIFLCNENAVALDGNVFHILGTRITSNEIVGCGDVAVSTTGFSDPASSMTISRNDFWSAGDGIRCAAEGVLIEGNRLVNSEKQNNGSNAIMLVSGSPIFGTASLGLDQAHILANQVINYGGAGIQVSTPVGALIVKQNIVEDCGQGIASIPTSKAGKVSIENNQLRRLGMREPQPDVAGIQVFQAETATITGNTIRALGMQKQNGAATCTGISTWTVDRVRVMANEMIDIGPEAFQGTATGILLRNPLGDFEVHHNRVERETVAIEATAGNWTALRVGELADAPGAASTASGAPPPPPPPPVPPPPVAGNSNQARIGSLNLIFFNSNWFLGFARLLAPSGSILGNVIKARGARPAVEVTAKDCLFNDNRLEVSVFRTAAVALSTWTAIVSANRVIGGDPSISAGGSSVVMLGNITSGGVIPLVAPFTQLNPVI